MWSPKLVCLLVSAIAFVHGQSVPKYTPRWVGPLAGKPKPPQVAVPRLILERWFNTKVDHFSDTDESRWNMRYFSNDAHYVPGGPLFIFVGGEWEISYQWVVAGHMYDMARETNGMVFHTEHRYYGASHPTPDTSTENLRYLTSGQAMEDLAQFIVYQRATVRGASNSKVVLVGTSYSGSLVTWFSQKYPELVDFAWASSAPLHAQVDMFEFKEVVGEAIRSVGGDTCHSHIVGAFTEMEEAVDSGNADRVVTTFNLCNPLTNTVDTWTFFAGATTIMSALVQAHEGTLIQLICELFDFFPFESDMEAYANIFFNSTGECMDARYITMRMEMGETEWTAETVVAGARQWYYQSCNELGWYQTTTSDNQPFGSKVPVELYLQMCMDFFNSHFDLDSVYANIAATNEDRYGFEPDIANVFSTHGEWDPWRPMGLQRELNETSPVVVLSGVAHSSDLQSISLVDTPQLADTKQRISDLVREVLGY